MRKDDPAEAWQCCLCVGAMQTGNVTLFCSVNITTPNSITKYFSELWDTRTSLAYPFNRAPPQSTECLHLLIDPAGERRARQRETWQRSNTMAFCLKWLSTQITLQCIHCCLSASIQQQRREWYLWWDPRVKRDTHTGSTGRESAA